MPVPSASTRRARASTDATLTLAALPYDTLVHLCSSIDGLAELAAMARTSKTFHSIIQTEAICWEKITLPAAALTAYLRQSPHCSAARVLNVHLPERATHRPTFCKHAPSRNSLEFAPALVARCGSVLDEGVREIVDACPLLTELRLPGSGHLSSEALCFVLDGLKQLEVLELRGCEHVTVDFAATAMAGTLPVAHRLRQLSLSHCSQAIDEDVSALLMALPGLQSLDMSFCPALGDASLERLPPPLASLRVLGCPRMSFNRLQILSRILGAQLVSDDSAILACAMCEGKERGQTLIGMLAWYQEEEARWAY